MHQVLKQNIKYCFAYRCIPSPKLPDRSFYPNSSGVSSPTLLSFVGYHINACKICFPVLQKFIGHSIRLAVNK